MSLAKSPNACRILKTYVHAKPSLFYVTTVSVGNYKSVFTQFYFAPRALFVIIAIVT